MRLTYPGGTIIKEGELDKWCKNRKQWKPKWVIIELRHNVYVLSYFKIDNIRERMKEDDIKTEKDVILKGIKMCVNKKNRLIFSVKTSLTKRRYKFRARTIETIDEWHVEILKILHDEKNIPVAVRCQSSISAENKSEPLTTSGETSLTSRSSFTVRSVSNNYRKKFKALWKKKKTEVVSSTPKSPTSHTSSSLNSKGEYCKNNVVDEAYKTFDLQNQTAFNRTDLIAKKLKQLKTLSKNISTLISDTSQSSELPSTDHNSSSLSSNKNKKLNIIEQHNILACQIDDIFHNYMNIMQREDLVDFINNYCNEYTFKMDPFYSSLSMNVTSYAKFASLCIPLLMESNMKFKFSILPIEAIKPKPLTELISCVFAQPSYLFNVINPNDGNNHVHHFTIYLCRCLQELIINKFLHVGFCLFPIPNEYFSCYFTHAKIPNFKIFISTKCVSLNPLRIAVHATDNQYKFDLEINLILSWETNEGLSSINIRSDGVFTLWEPEDNLQFSTSGINLLYKQDCVSVELIDNISINSVENKFSSTICLKENPCETLNINMALSDGFDSPSVAVLDNKIPPNTNITTGWLHKLNFLNFWSTNSLNLFHKIFRIPLLLWCTLISFLSSLISYDNALEGHNQLASIDEPKSKSYIPKVISQNDFECRINVKPFICCTFNENLLANEEQQVYNDSQCKQICYSIDALNTKYYNEKSNEIDCYVMQSKNAEKEKYSSRTLWSNVITCIENKDKENFLRELTAVQSKIQDSS